MSVENEFPRRNQLATARLQQRILALRDLDVPNKRVAELEGISVSLASRHYKTALERREELAKIGRRSCPQKPKY